MVASNCRKLILLIAVIVTILIVPAPSWCQTESPKAEIYGGYSYLNVDTNGLSPRQSANGWNVGADGNFTNRLGAEFELNGYYRIISGVSVTDYSYVAGPRLNFRPVFVHALIGGDDLIGSASGSSANQSGLAVALGGGIEYSIFRHLAIRGSGDYVLTRHNIEGGSSVDQNNFRFGMGIVFSFGGDSRRTPPIRSAVAPTPQPIRHLGLENIPLLGIAGVASDRGFIVQSESVGSSAADASINIGDVIRFVNGHEVHTGDDVTSAIGAASIVHVTYMIQGNWAGANDVAVKR